MNEQLKVGFGRVDITPEEYCNLGGLGNDHLRMCENILDRIMGTCVALSDGENTVLLCLADLINPAGKLVEDTRAAVTAATGVPEDHIMVAVSHTHSGPATSFPALERVAAYYPYLTRQMAKAAVDAMADLTPASILVGQKEVRNMTFVRHYLMNDGTYAGANFGSFKSGVAAHADASDDQMQLVRFVREGARDVVLVNWQSHATITSARPAPDKMATNLSGDYPSVMRDHLEGLSGCKVAFIQGAAGNLVPSSHIKEEMIVEHNHILYGKKLAEFANEGLANMRPVESGPVRTKQQIFIGGTDHSEDHLAGVAQEVVDNFFDLPAGERMAYVHERGLNSLHHARGILARLKMGDSAELELNVISVGGLSFATAPYEMFNSNGRYIKAHTPFDLTVVMPYCNGSLAYLADKNAFRYSCYEVNTRRFCEGTAEAVVQTHIEMLNQLKTQ